MADDLEGDARLSALGADTVQVVTVNTFFPPSSPETLINMADDINSWMSQRIANRSRLIGTVSIPSPPALHVAGIAPDGESYTAKAISGIRKATVQLGLQGILLASNYDNIFLGDEIFEPYFAVAEELDVPIIIHPAVEPVETPFIPRKTISTYSGFLNDQRTTLLDLVMSGVYEKYPGITIIATHLSGGILSSLGRFRALSTRFPADTWYTDRAGEKKLLPRPINYYLRKIYYDCNNGDTTDIIHAVSTVGSGHLLTGSDFPWTNDSFDSFTRDVLGKLHSSIQADIAYNNAAKLFGYAPIRTTRFMYWYTASLVYHHLL